MRLRQIKNHFGVSFTQMRGTKQPDFATALNKVAKHRWSKGKYRRRKEASGAVISSRVLEGRNVKLMEE